MSIYEVNDHIFRSTIFAKCIHWNKKKVIEASTYSGLLEAYTHRTAETPNAKIMTLITISYSYTNVYEKFIYLKQQRIFV